MDFFAAYATNPALEQDGKDFDFGGGVTMRIARAHNPKYTRILNKLYEAHKHTLELKDTPEQQATAAETSHKIMAEVMSKSILLGWTGPVKYKGQDLPYSVENAKKLLLIKDFQEDVAKRAANFHNFRFEIEEADAKNSVTTSPGTSNGVAALDI